jgi:hypothetical protein
MRVCKALAVLLLLPLVATAQDKTPPEGWKEVKGGYKKEAYSVWLPADGKYDDKETSLITKQGQVRIFRDVVERKDGTIFAVGQINLPPALVKAQPKVRQDALRDMFLDEVNGKLMEEKKVSLGTMSGKEYLIKTPTGMARFRLFGTGVQMFRVAVIGTKDQVEAKDVDAFFDSFKRTPRAKTSEKSK